MLKYHFISLGCPKNEVDSQSLMGILEEENFSPCANPEHSDLIIINTCGFIEDAQRESIEEILQMAEYKKTLFVVGCLTQRFGQEIKKEIPEIDIIMGAGIELQFRGVIQAWKNGDLQLPYYNILSPFQNGDYSPETRKNEKKHYQYLKIAEGCDKRCSYCAIPIIRGSYRSRRMEIIISEAYNLVEKGAKELILVAQDTTLYGQDLYGKKVLPILLKELTKIPKLDWIRIMYLQPDGITDELLETIATEKKICRYLDLPLQHVSKKILHSMNRYGNPEKLKALINKIKGRIPAIALRTTIMVGFPGEDENDFEDLYRFLEWARFDRLGVFKFSAEEGTVAARMGKRISTRKKEERYAEIIKLRQQIAQEKNKSYENRVISVIVDYIEDGIAIGRTEWDAPDVDDIVYIEKGENLKIGNIYPVEIHLALENELVGEVCCEFTK